MSGEVQLLVDAINTLGKTSGRDVALFICNLSLVVAAGRSLYLNHRSLDSLKEEAQEQRKHQTDQKKQDREDLILREDIFSSSVFVSYKNIRNVNSVSVNPYGILKVSSENNGVNWKYILTEQNFQGDRIIYDSGVDGNGFGIGGYSSKYSAINDAFNYHNITSDAIEFSPAKF